MLISVFSGACDRRLVVELDVRERLDLVFDAEDIIARYYRASVDWNRNMYGKIQGVTVCVNS